MKVPIWKIWLSDKPLPEHFKQYTDTWDKISGGEVKEVTMDNIPDYMPCTHEDIDFILKKCKYNYQVFNHFIRYSIMYFNGGIYLDLDVEVLKDSDIWYSSEPTFFTETSVPLWINNHVMVCTTKNKDIYYELSKSVAFKSKDNKKIEINTGPGLITSKAYYPDFIYKVYPPEYTTPWNWNEKPDRSRITENTIAVHHFAHSWKK